MKDHKGKKVSKKRILKSARQMIKHLEKRCSETNDLKEMIETQDLIIKGLEQAIEEAGYKLETTLTFKVVQQ